jgi:hypothetical protein
MSSTAVPQRTLQSTHNATQCMSISNIDTALTAQVTLLQDDRYSVRIRNDDTGNILPTIRIFPTYAQAYEYMCIVVAD